MGGSAGRAGAASARVRPQAPLREQDAHEHQGAPDGLVPRELLAEQQDAERDTHDGRDVRHRRDVGGTPGAQDVDVPDVGQAGAEHAEGQQLSLIHI